MAVFKCKACGGNLDIEENTRIVKCAYCDTSQTVPAADDDEKTRLFNQANKARMEGEFDRAERRYEEIVSKFPEEPEAYWGLCLCKYGIEYVDDPSTGLKVPTCHRSSFESILDDSNFEIACENADSDMRKMYREEAKEIDRIQQGILEIAAREDPYDIFICYKETAEDGQRTKDSVLAQDIYDALTAKSYKVFFARITLEDKLGQEYEPYIFSALTTAKVMLVVGTQNEHFEARWVKNEWGRFLKFMKKDKEKVLVPCYCDMDAYDLPREFKNIQAQDMSKMGFIQDLVRNIGKIINPMSGAAIVNTGGATVESLVMRAEDFLKDREWQNAKEYSEKVLDINPRYAPAYLTNLMAQLGISRVEDIGNCYREIRDNPNYRKFMEYADDKLKKEMRPHFEKAEISRKYRVYEVAMGLAKSNDMDEVRKAMNMFDTIPDWEDSKAQLTECRRKVINHDLANEETDLKDAKKALRKSKNIFRMFPSIFWLAVIIVGAIAMLVSYNEYTEAVRTMAKDTAMGNLFIGLGIAGVGGIASIMRLFHWDGLGKLIGASLINYFTVGIFGAVASIINLIRDKVNQSREVKANRKVVNDINTRITKLNSALSQLK